ncbi:Solute carrier family 22 member 9 [Sciurus carolinensis]|uniref:Solute carrier family 22 member 9 n=1 Tax=Sciurus carolinensis TaxID=30640 RepID=A0AA41N089_SCICA|nr:Solute carrier family 22 member 9 [Sciurus carolinensis]
MATDLSMVVGQGRSEMVSVFGLVVGWVSESARWLIINNKPEEGLQKLKKAARVNGMETSADALTMEVVRSTMKEELKAAQKKHSLCDLFRTPNLCKRICLLSLIRFATWLPTFGLIIHLQHLGSNVFLVQILLGVVTLPANYLSFLALNYKGRRISHFIFTSMLGISFLAKTFVPEGTYHLPFACPLSVHHLPYTYPSPIARGSPPDRLMTAS